MNNLDALKSKAFDIRNNIDILANQQNRLAEEYNKLVAQINNLQQQGMSNAPVPPIIEEVSEPSKPELVKFDEKDELVEEYVDEKESN